MNAPTPHSALAQAWSRAPGNPYASDATYIVAATLGSDARCHAMIEEHRLRGPDGRVDPQRMRTVFMAMARMALQGHDRSFIKQIDWKEVADEFIIEGYSARERQAQATPGGLAERAAASAAAAAAVPTTVGAAGDHEGADAPGKPIDADVMAVLLASLATDGGIKLPAQRLERGLYDRVNKVLEALGGRWNRRAGVHSFGQDDPDVVLEMVQRTGRYIDPKEYGFFPTPDAVVSELLEAAGLRPGMRVLEPSAGTGAIARRAADVVGTDNVLCVELLHRHVRELKEARLPTVHADFMALQPSDLSAAMTSVAGAPDDAGDAHAGLADVVLMNPPFGNLADTLHVMHSLRFVKPTGSVCAIMSPSFKFRSHARASVFKDMLDECGEMVGELPAGTFKDSGTNVRTVIVKLDAGAAQEYLDAHHMRDKLGLPDAGRFGRGRGNDDDDGAHDLEAVAAVVTPRQRG